MEKVRTNIVNEGLSCPGFFEDERLRSYSLILGQRDPHARYRV